ncbi:MAG: HSP70 family protein [Ardenticatenaceae bacterium]|nr:HSP70 family protein [Ardenticatenaceae bacterium]MCB9443036.1 HSP70 family protein [Ardenticatenaceae bacterium]
MQNNILAEKTTKTRVVVGIDFGTSRSGYAYAFTNINENSQNENIEIYGRTRWPGQPEAFPKTLTQLLYAPNGNVLAWGFEARKKLAEIRNNSQNVEQYDFFPSFKMELHQELDQGDTLPSIKTPNGKEYLVTSLISDFLSLLKDEVLEELNRNTAGYINPKEILWCLTVPAIWTDRDKQFMREAARKAGLIGLGYDEDQRLRLALEPEVAAIHCMKNAKFDLKLGNRFMVVDCGGGTVDITVHEKVANGKLEELAAGTGGPYGSRYVDVEFLSFMRSILTAGLIDDFVSKEPLEYLEILDHWERLKCNYDPAKNEQNFRIPFPIKLYQLLEKHPEILGNLRKIQGGADEFLIIPRVNLEKMFNKIIDGIIHEVHKQFSRLEQKQCDYLFLVGGFATSPLLQERVKKAFSELVSAIIIPPRPSASVVEGAVLFGLTPIEILRIMRVTYGCGANMPFRSEVDPEIKKFWHKERRTYYCKDRFSVFVHAGEKVEVNQKAVQIFNPSQSNQTSVGFTFYISPNNTPEHIDEAEVIKIGDLIVDSPDTTGGIDREIEVSFYFGRTEIQVEAIDKNTRKQVETQLKFH